MSRPTSVAPTSLHSSMIWCRPDVARSALQSSRSLHIRHGGGFHTPATSCSTRQPTIYDELGRPWTPRNADCARVGQWSTSAGLAPAPTTGFGPSDVSLSPSRSHAPHAQLRHHQQARPVIALCLGPCDVSVKEMVTAYSAFANKGMRVDPVFVTAITPNNNGNIISEFTPRHTEVISTDAYYKITLHTAQRS